jgi:adenosylcobyric acid synthase
VVRGNMDAACYYKEKKQLWPAVTESYNRLSDDYHVIVLEGAGSPVEINLKENDIVNTAMAEYADAKSVLVADIDRGGVFASIVGTVELLEKEDRERLIGFIINKFRGDVSLLKSGLEFIEQKTGLPVLGVVPYIRNLYIPGEDSVSLDTRTVSVEVNGAVRVGIIRFPHISNYTDFDPLECDQRFHVQYIDDPQMLSYCDVVILPGSKNIFSDYMFLVNSRLKDGITEYYQAGGMIAGICGGYQILGESIDDPHGFEASSEAMTTLGLLPVESVIEQRKVTERVSGMFRFPGQDTSLPVEGYEIHMGKTTLREEGCVQVLTPDSTDSERIGIASSDGRVLGTYIHGIFESSEICTGFYRWVTKEDVHDGQSVISYNELKQKSYELLADTVEEHVNLDYIFQHIGLN